MIAKMKGTFEPEVLEQRKDLHKEQGKLRELKIKRKLINRLMRLRQQTATMAGSDPTFETRFTLEGGDQTGSRT